MSKEVNLISPPDCYKKYNSAKHRFLKQTINDFFAKELPKLFGPKMREKLADELVSLVTKMMPEKDYVKPGQIVWNAVDINTRADSRDRRFVPVVLTLIDDKDVEMLINGTKMSVIAENAIARIHNETFDQGGLISQRDIGLFTWRLCSDISKKRKAYEKRTDTILPNVGTLHDVGTCISHKTEIIRKIVFENKDIVRVARETNHSLKSVENYLKDYRRVETCYNISNDIEFITQVTGFSKFLIKQYLEIIKNH